jgi:integrase
VLTEDEIRTLWRAWDTLDPSMGALFKLRLLTAQRGGEVGAMRWQGVDLEAGWWTIPATATKNKLAHRAALNPSAVRLLATLYATASPDAAYVLAGARGKRQQAVAAADFGVENFRGHDLRRTAATAMASGGINRLVIGKVLNHAETGVTAIYDRATYDEQKAAALAWWDLKLKTILDNKGGTVLAFARG